jgi:hypothetical protein
VGDEIDQSRGALNVPVGVEVVTPEAVFGNCSNAALSGEFQLPKNKEYQASEYSS